MTQGPLGVQLRPFNRLWLENGVAIRVKSGTLLQQLDPTEGAQQPSSEIGFRNWVWAFEWPTQPCIQLRLYFIFYYFQLFNYSFNYMQMVVLIQTIFKFYNLVQV